MLLHLTTIPEILTNNHGYMSMGGSHLTIDHHFYFVHLEDHQGLLNNYILSNHARNNI
jgi:hypothetical protein